MTTVNGSDDDAWDDGLEELDKGLEPVRRAAQLLLNADGDRRYVADRVISASLLVVMDTLFPNWREELPSLQGCEEMAICYADVLTPDAASKRAYLTWSVKAEPLSSQGRVA
jgi:hypothetical protein